MRIPRLFDLLEPDKIGHFFFYAVLFLLINRGAVQGKSYWKGSGSVRLNILAITVAYGGLIELYQGYLLSDRVADWIDFLANIIGAVLGVLITRLPLYRKFH